MFHHRLQGQVVIEWCSLMKPAVSLFTDLLLAWPRARSTDVSDEMYRPNVPHLLHTSIPYVLSVSLLVSVIKTHSIEQIKPLSALKSTCLRAAYLIIQIECYKAIWHPMTFDQITSTRDDGQPTRRSASSHHNFS